MARACVILAVMRVLLAMIGWATESIFPELTNRASVEQIWGRTQR